MADHRLTRRAALGLGAAAAATPLLSACGIGGAPAVVNGAAGVTGGFDWKKAAGTTIKVLQTPHPYQQSFQPLLKEFSELTGIEVITDLVPESSYFTKLNTELAGGTGKHDAFMLGAYFIWQYGPPNWLEDLKPWIENPAATHDEYDFEDIYEGLRQSTQWDFQAGSPLGSGGQWAIPWGFENNVVTYNKKYFDSKGIRLPDRFDDFIQLAVDLTDRTEVLGDDPPGLHDPVQPGGRRRLRVRERCVHSPDELRPLGRLPREVDRADAAGRTHLLDDVRLPAGHR
jgi:multiple sugar transport system substrate-binding protein